jgi:hypothetical protein
MTQEEVGAIMGMYWVAEDRPVWWNWHQRHHGEREAREWDNRIIGVSFLHGRVVEKEWLTTNGPQWDGELMYALRKVAARYGLSHYLPKREAKKAAQKIIAQEGSQAPVRQWLAMKKEETKKRQRKRSTSRW